MLQCGEEFGPPPADEPALEFEFACDSPFTLSVGGEYVIADSGPRGRVHGMCPLCNNYAHDEIDALLANGELKAVARMGFTKDEVARHLRNHSGPVYAASGRAVVEVEEARLRPASVVKVLAVDAALRRADGPGPDPVGSFGETNGAVRARRYAFDKGAQIRSLRPWTVARTRLELEDRVAEAINFYDEMLELRQMTREIHTEATAEIEDPRGNGTMLKYGLDGLKVGLSAVREMRGVVETLGKMSLIAKKLSDDEDGGRVSPELQSIIDSVALRRRNAIAGNQGAEDVPAIAAPRDRAAEAARDLAEIEGEIDSLGALLGDEDE